MMKFLWRSRSSTALTSVTWRESQIFPGVKFAIRQVSLRARLELMQTMRELIAENEFLQAGGALDQTDAAISDLLAKQLYVQWGLKGITGLRIDGGKPDVVSLIKFAPEQLCDEIVDSIRASLELTETERKNS